MPNRQDNIKFLTEHFRYHTLNSWNQSTSYAVRCKLNDVVWPSKKVMYIAYNFLDVPEAFHGFHQRFHQFDFDHQYRWQIGQNGRSGGYLVLYCGGVGADSRAFSYPGKAIDQGETFEDWDDKDIEGRVELVKQFDQACADAIQSFVEFVSTHRLEERTIQVSQKIIMPVAV